MMNREAADDAFGLRRFAAGTTHGERALDALDVLPCVKREACASYDVTGRPLDAACEELPLDATTAQCGRDAARLRRTP